ncbi:MAG: hypothetical protein ACREQM_21750 [Candidatus Dormibacteraceae bacterium]
MLAGIGFLGMLAAIVLAIVYLLNDLGLLWTNTLGLQVFSLWSYPAALILLGAVVAAAIPALSIQLRSDYAQQIGFTVAFGLLSFVLAAGTRIALELPSGLAGGTVSSLAVGIDPALVLLAGLVLGGILSVLGPLVATTPIGERAVYLSSALVARFARPAPAADVHPPLTGDAAGQGPGWPVGSAGFGATRTAVLPVARPRPIHVPRLAWAAAAAICVLVIALLVGNGIGTRETQPQTIAESYVGAVGHSSVDDIWNSFDEAGVGAGYQTDTHQPAPSGLVDLATKQGLSKLLRIPANRQ